MEAEKDLPSLRGVVNKPTHILAVCIFASNFFSLFQLQSSFQKVLIVQAFRPDRLQSAILQFVTDVLRIDSVSPPPLSLATLHSESSNQTPLLFISSPGADPSKELQEFAAKTVGLGNYEELAMGGGQQEIAQNLLRNAAANGTWLCLKNLHLVVAWLPTLEKEVYYYILTRNNSDDNKQLIMHLAIIDRGAWRFPLVSHVRGAPRLHIYPAAAIT